MLIYMYNTSTYYLHIIQLHLGSVLLTIVKTQIMYTN